MRKQCPCGRECYILPCPSCRRLEQKKDITRVRMENFHLKKRLEKALRELQSAEMLSAERLRYIEFLEG